MTILIAMRKGVRSCIQHSITNHLKFSEWYRAFTAKIDSLEISRDIQSALYDPHWKSAVPEKMDTLTGNDKCEIIDFPWTKELLGANGFSQ